MKRKKLELLRSKLAMFAMATSLSVTSLSGCSSNNILSTEKIEKSITKEQDFANNAGLYKSQDGTWKIYFEKEGNYYDLKSYEYLDKAIYHASIYTNDAKVFGFDVGYLPFIRCNPNVTYTLNVVNNLDEADIEKLKNDFFQKNSFWTEDIRLFYIEGIDGTKQKTIIGYPVSKIEIFNIETWQFENYEGNAIVEESCKFKNKYVYLSEILDYLNEELKNKEVSTIVTESTLEEKETIETEKKLEKITEVEEIDEEENVGYEIKPYSSDSNSIKINIDYNFTSKDLTEVLNVLNQKDKIKTLSIDAHHKYLAISEEIFKEISAKDNIEELELCGFENLNLSNIVRMSNLKWLSLMSCTMEDNTQLNQFTQLEHLNLVDVISDLNAISNLTQLKDLLVINFDIEKLKDIEILSQFKNLETLQLPDHSISNIRCLSELNQLYTLDLRNNKIKDIKSLESLENLGYVSLKGNPITDVSVLKDMKSAPMIYFGDEVNIDNLKPYISELTEKGFKIHYGSDNELITKEYFERKEELQLKLNK